MTTLMRNPLSGPRSSNIHIGTITWRIGGAPVYAEPDEGPQEVRQDVQRNHKGNRHGEPEVNP